MTVNTTNTVPKSKNARIENIKERALAHIGTTEFRALTILLTALMLWATAIVVFGYPALILVALALVPVIFFLLLMITVGK